MVAIITSYYRAIAIHFKAQNLRKFSFLLVIDKCLHYFKAWRLHRHRHHHLQLQLQYKFQQQQRQKSVHITINFCAVFYSCIYFHWNMCFLWLLLLLYLGCFNCFMLQIRNEDSTFSLPGCIRMEGVMLEHNRRWMEALLVIELKLPTSKCCMFDTFVCIELCSSISIGPYGWYERN